MLTKKEFIEKLRSDFDYKYKVTSSCKFNINDLTEEQFKEQIIKSFNPDDVIITKDPNISRSGTLFKVLKDGNEYNVVMKPKNDVRGTQNDEQEVGFLIILNALYNGAQRNNTIDEMLLLCNFDDIYDGDEPIDDELKNKTELFLKTKPSWFECLKNQAIAFKHELKKKPKRYIKDNKIYKINLFARCELGFTRKDKWNPSDVWLSMDGKTSDSYLKKYNTGKSLNDFLYDSIENKNGLIGVSLKSNEIIKDVHISKVSNNENAIIQNTNNYKPTFGQKGIFDGALTKKLKLISDNETFMIDIRQFQNKPLQNLQSEIFIPKSKGMGGKSNLKKYFDIKREYKIESKYGSVEYIDKFRQELYIDFNMKIKPFGRYCFNKCSDIYDNIKQNIDGRTIFDEFNSIDEIIERFDEFSNKLDEPIHDINSILVSQCMAIMFMDDLLSIESKKYQMNVLIEWVNHAMGTTNISARHYKVD